MHSLLGQLALLFHYYLHYANTYALAVLCWQDNLAVMRGYTDLFLQQGFYTLTED